MSARTEGFEALTQPDMERRIANAIRYGHVMEIDYAKKKIRVKSGDIETDWINFPGSRAGSGKRTWSPPNVGEQGMLLSPGGDMRQATFVAGVYQDAHDAPSADPNSDKTEYSDGTVIEYNRGSHTLTADLGVTKITADRSMLVLECNGSKIELSAAGIKLIGARIDLN